jgi:ribonuclease HII
LILKNRGSKFIIINNRQLKINDNRVEIDPLFYERQLWRRGYNYIAGIDEVGRGPLAGPVYACAVIFRNTYFHREVRDSKKISPEKRISIAQTLCHEAAAWSIGQASVSEIDELNIRQATFLAMRRALQALESKVDYVLVDGEKIPEISMPLTALIKGDEKSFTIGAASIIGKVKRDAYMVQLHEIFPQYDFAANKGYGTAAHIRALRSYGASPHHRKTFLTKIIAY